MWKFYLFFKPEFAPWTPITSEVGSDWGSAAHAPRNQRRLDVYLAFKWLRDIGHLHNKSETSICDKNLSTIAT